jgi:hypothetical protein
MSRITALLVPTLVLCAVAVAAAGAVAWGNFHVDGPRSVRIGQEVRFPTTGLKPNELVTVNVAPTLNRGGNCCGIDVITNARADAHGEAILHFRWPRYYYNGTEKVRWRRGAKADVYVLADSGRGRRVVRVRGR